MTGSVPDVGDLYGGDRRETVPPTLPTEPVAKLLGVSRGAVWAAARDEGGIVVGDELITPVRVGRALRWPTFKILAALGLAGDGVPALTSDLAPCESPSNGEESPRLSVA